MGEKLLKVKLSSCTEGLDSGLIQCIIKKNTESCRGSTAGLV